MHLNGENCLNMITRAKLAGNGQMGKLLMFIKNVPRGSSAPAPGQ